MDNTEYLLQVCETFDEPLPYGDWTITPVKLRNYFDFDMCYGILDIDKNSLGIPEIISMPYLKFLMLVVRDEDDNMLERLGVLFNLCLGIEETPIYLLVDEKERFSLKIDDKVITAKQFDVIRHIILKQNLVSYRDMSKVDPSLKKNIEEYYRIKNAGVKMPTLEKKIAIVQSETGIPKRELIDMTIRSFDMLFNTVVDKVDYKINKTAEMSGMVKFDKPIEHWIWKDDKDPLSDAFVSYNTLENKVNSTK
jgi:hypothetical protein